MGYSFRADSDGRRIRPSRDALTDRRGIRPSMDTSTYRHRDVGYGHSSQQYNAPGVQHHFITPRQRQPINITIDVIITICFLGILIFFA